jgi:hypothetical protein
VWQKAQTRPWAVVGEAGDAVHVVGGADDTGTGTDACNGGAGAECYEYCCGQNGFLHFLLSPFCIFSVHGEDCST